MTMVPTSDFTRKDRIALKVNSLYDSMTKKLDRNQVNFLSKFHNDVIILQGLPVNTEPSNRNQNGEVLDSLHKKLQSPITKASKFFLTSILDVTNRIKHKTKRKRTFSALENNKLNSNYNQQRKEKVLSA